MYLINISLFKSLYTLFMCVFTLFFSFVVLFFFDYFSLLKASLIRRIASMIFSSLVA